MTKKYAWELSLKNSAIQFKVKWFGISSISGQFSKFHTIVMADQSFTDPEIHLFIEAASAETADEKWNNALQHAGFLSAELHPVIEFTSIGGCLQSSGKIWEMSGDLTIKKIKQNITFVVSTADIRREKKKTVSIFQLFGSISRAAFSLHCEQDEEIADEIQLKAVITMTRASD